MNGCLRLKAKKVGNRTALTELFRTAPFHLGLPALQDDGSIEIILQEVGPGLLPGDTTETEIEVGPGAHLTLRGQAATKLYPCPIGERIATTTRLHVCAGGSLHYLPGELIPYKEAKLAQRLDIDIEKGGQVVISEIITPGRVAMGERDRYRTLSLRLHAHLNGALVLAERTLLDPARQPVDLPGRRGNLLCFGTLWLIGFGTAAMEVGQSAADDPVWWGSGGDEQVSVVRILGPGVQAVRATQSAVLEHLLRSCRKIM